MDTDDVPDAALGPRIPAEVWDKKQMRDALASREISSIYRLMRKEGISQRQIAAMTGQSQSEVSEILKGRQVIAYDVLARIADGLGAPRGYMGLAYDEATEVDVVGAADEQQAEEDESVKRRKFLTRAAEITMGAAVLGQPAQAWAASATRTPAPQRIGMTDVRQVETATKALRALDYQYGGGFCRDAVIAQLSWGKQLIGAGASDRVKNRLYVALVDLHSLAGWTSFDIGLHDAARNHFGYALQLAKQGESEPLVANVLYRMGRVYLHDHAANDALKMFQLGQLAAQNAQSELAVAVLCANQAWSYAMLGKKEDALSQLGRAQDEFERADVEGAESWVKFFDKTDLYAMIGTVRTELALGDHPEQTTYAIPALTRAINSYGDDMARSKTFNLGALATNHLIEGDIDHGANIGTRALEIGEDIKSKRVRDRLRPLQTEAVRRQNNPDARDLVERLNNFYAT